MQRCDTTKVRVEFPCEGGLNPTYPGCSAVILKETGYPLPAQLVLILLTLDAAL